MRDLMKVKNENMLRALAYLGHARVMIVLSLPTSSQQVEDVTTETPLWDKYSYLINHMLESEEGSMTSRKHYGYNSAIDSLNIVQDRLQKLGLRTKFNLPLSSAEPLVQASD